ncbi:MAG: hypothetical protein ACRDRO_30455 [Pseudonocardiaceae bacterium]
MTAPDSPTSPAETKRKTDLNLAHVAAAALAAVTTAVLGSELGADGTLIGAAGASVITTVGTAVYQMSLERSRKRVRSLAQRARPSPTAQHQAEPSHRSRRSVALRWGAVIVGSLGAFLVAMTVITGFEWANGQTVGGNGKGTTIGQVINDQPAVPKPTTPLRPGAPAGSETPTETPTQTSQPPGGILPGLINSPTSTTTPEPTPTPTSTSDEVTPTPPTPPPLIPPVLGGGG